MIQSLFTKAKLLIAAIVVSAGFSHAGISIIVAPGSYNGLVTPSSGSLPAVSTTGFFTATAVGTPTTFTGKLTIDGETLPVSGKFDSAGNGLFGAGSTPSLTITRTNKPSLILALAYDLTTGNPRLVGTVTQKYRSTTTAVSSIVADLATYDGKTALTTVPAGYLGANNADGLFTAILPALDPSHQPLGFSTADYPQGTGFGTVKITKAGVASISGTLADGTTFSASAPLSKHIGMSSSISWPLFTQLYSKGGFLCAKVILDSTNASSDLAVDSAGVKWYRPFSLSQYYPYGWPEVVTTGFLAAKYVVTPNQSVIPGITPVGPGGTPGNAHLQCRDGTLTANFDRGLLISNSDTITKFPSTDTSYTLSITRASGLMTGTFLHTDGTKPSFKGIIYQKGTTHGGFGFFLSTSPKVLNYLGQGGSVALTPITVT